MLRLYNTQIRDKQDFIPLEEGKVRMYVCGLRSTTISTWGTPGRSSRTTRCAVTWNFPDTR